MESSIQQHAQIVSLLEIGERESIRRALASHIQRLDVEQTGLAVAYPDYVASGDESGSERRIGTL